MRSVRHDSQFGRQGDRRLLKGLCQQPAHLAFEKDRQRAYEVRHGMPDELAVYLPILGDGQPHSLSYDFQGFHVVRINDRYAAFRTHVACPDTRAASRPLAAQLQVGIGLPISIYRLNTMMPECRKCDNQKNNSTLSEFLLSFGQRKHACDFYGQGEGRTALEGGDGRRPALTRWGKRAVLSYRTHSGPHPETTPSHPIAIPNSALILVAPHLRPDARHPKSAHPGALCLASVSCCVGVCPCPTPQCWPNRARIAVGD